MMTVVTVILTITVTTSLIEASWDRADPAKLYHHWLGSGVL